MPTPPVLDADIDLRKISAAIAVAVLAGAGTVFALWLIGDPAVIGMLTYTMKANTSASLSALAAAMLLALRGKTSWARAVAVLAVILTALTFAQYVFGVSLGVDQLLARDAARPEGTYPGRMAPNAAQSLATLGVSLVLFLHPRRRVAGWLALLVVFESILALIGYLLGTKSLYQVARALRISEYTATGLLLLCIAALAAWPQGTAVHVLVQRTPGGMLARRILPPLIAIPVLLGFLRNAGERAGLYDDALGTALMIAGMLPLVAVLIWFNARSIDRLDEAQRRISAENERLAAEARSAVATRDEFIALAGHELRTPLTALRLRVQLEERRTEGARAAEVQRWIRLVDRLARLVETMLDVTRLASQRLELQRRTLDLQAVVNGTVERLSAVFTAAGTGVQVRGDAGVWVHADPLRIEQAVENILLNAAKYAAGGDVEVLVARDDGWARISIRDSGIGIAPADQERIFTRFERAAPAENFGGLGLGLYLVRQVMDAHGGTVTVDSLPGKGATFHLRLPLADGAGKALPA